MFKIQNLECYLAPRSRVLDAFLCLSSVMLQSPCFLAAPDAMVSVSLPILCNAAEPLFSGSS
jgi:hypothetical protein